MTVGTGNLSINVNTSGFEAILQRFVLFSTREARERPITTLILSIAFTALGVTTTEFIVALFPVPVVMPVLRAFIDWTLFASLTWIAYHAVNTVQTILEEANTEEAVE